MKFVDMFCGIGGFRLGLERANRETDSGKQENPPPEEEAGEGLVAEKGQGSCHKERQSDRSDNRQPDNREYHCVWANDNDKYACQIYRRHWDDGTLQEGDIRAIDASAVPEHDLLCAGFPCQSFSIAGKRRGFEDTRGTLFFEICRIIGAKRPRYILLENVRGLLSHDLGQTFEVILSSLSGLGYDCQWQVLNSKDFGVPQNRERVFVVGNLRGQPRPQVFPIGETDTVYSEIATCLDANYGKGWLDHGQRTMIYDIYNKQLRANQNLAGALKGEGIAGTSLGAALIFKYGVMGDKNKKWLVDGRENSRNFPQGQRVYSVDGISATLDGEAGGWGGKTGLYEIPLVAQALQTDGQLRQGVSWGTDKPQSARNIRRLTPIECERLQCFPDGWTQCGLTKEGEQTGISDTQRYKGLGNAVTTSVVAAIGGRLLGEIGGHR